ncbi:dihydrofolate reductase [Quisquiliibacterium transsilvanicum]|uniref:Dihydrofolate reductase n=1 Tax=Quisquiliibacterium transsilvanicum TaxID=1549638 RepID=A0A7W8MAD1_9BURK|nr:dihydrofolate reductase [Quisquiliibacterium transsilvanicum]MBB5273823.1 dihydrofolate reductase [Quisquiliibacterium transsilvanicum]
MAASSPRPRVTIVVARARNGVIGHRNALPWRLPEDLRHFKAVTTGHAILMGRRTFESIGRALPGRRTIVVTRNPDWRHEGCERAASLDEAIAIAARPGPDPAIATDEVFVIGGAQLYREALPRADRALVTEIALEPEGDAHFAALAPPHWTLRASRAEVSASGLAYRIEDWERSRAEGADTG